MPYCSSTVEKVVLGFLQPSSDSDGGAMPLALHSMTLGFEITHQPRGSGHSISRPSECTVLILNQGQDRQPRTGR